MGLDVYLKWAGMTEQEQKAQCTGFRSEGKVDMLNPGYVDIYIRDIERLKTELEKMVSQKAEFEVKLKIGAYLDESDALCITYEENSLSSDRNLGEPRLLFRFARLECYSYVGRIIWNQGYIGRRMG